ncbi:P-loop containing nucleoside triphosphate hydrolase protein [Lipomyces japonicus]|uniref:P-loop containing nucleoside triphosphate hydrolase protein n=1 Tax=Lipomyces japonicus TaxID=56871 RepID=UPI0034CEC1F0
MSFLDLRSEIIHHNHLFSLLASIFSFIFIAGLLLLLSITIIGDGRLVVIFTKSLEPSKQASASICSLLTFSWVTPIIISAFYRPLIIEDIWDLMVGNDSITLTKNLIQSRNSSHSFFTTLAQWFKHDLMHSSVWTIARSIAVFVPVLVINKIIDYVQFSTYPSNLAIFYALLFLASAIASSTANGQALWKGRQISLKARALIISEIHAKALRCKLAATEHNAMVRSSDTSSIVNLIGIDAFKISEAAATIHAVVGSTVTIFIGLVVLWNLIGYAALGGIFVVAISIPIHYFYAIQFNLNQNKLSRSSKIRQHLTSEVLINFKQTKFFGWEEKFFNTIRSVRNAELEYVNRGNFIGATSTIVRHGAPVLVSLFSLSIYVLFRGKELTFSVGFSVLALCNLLRAPLDELGNASISIVQSRVSFKRIQRFLEEEETDKYNQVNTFRRDKLSPYIGFENASFSWDEESADTFQLTNLKIDFKVGELTIIIGPPGSGKSSLLIALLGEMSLIGGKVFTPTNERRGRENIPQQLEGYSESFAYASQEPWVKNDSIRNNILFGNAFDEERYSATVQACCLARDFSLFDYGDQTQIGERGMKLSKGQKQRIALARAIYSRARHLLLDDCLSAVERNTVRKINDRCFAGRLMRSRTCVFVTNDKSLLKLASHVVGLTNGLVIRQGPPDEVLRPDELEPDKDPITEPPDEVEAQQIKRHVAGVNGIPITGTLAKADEKAQSYADMSTYQYCFSAVGRPRFWVRLIALFLIYELVYVTLTLCLYLWAKDGTVYGVSDFYFLIAYGVLCMFYTFGAFVRDSYLFKGSLRASKVMFETVLRRVLRAKPRFFDETPVGRLINKFSENMESVDQEFAGTILRLGESCIALIAVVLFPSIITPFFLIPLTVLSIILGIISNLYVKCARELRRLQVLTKSPIEDQFGEILAGIQTIRAYGSESRFLAASAMTVDENNRVSWLLWAVNGWIRFYVGLISNLLTFLSIIIVILLAQKLNSGLVGLALSYTLLLTPLIEQLVMSYAENIIAMDKIERIKTYQNIDQETQPIVYDNRPPPGWPYNGAVVIEDLSLRYAPGLPLAVKRLSLTIAPGEKIAIVGRTGAGKTTLASGFFRFLEAETGKILLDGVDISSIGLDDLRSVVSMVPRNPTLFTGTIRNNVDPFGGYSDDAVTAALAKVHLSSLPLDMPVSSGGTNISQAQRQLLCFARAVLREPKILIMNEAALPSSELTYQTQIEQIIRTEFPQTTVITVARRLRSIVDYDKVLVLDAGESKGFAHPHELLQTPRSVFRTLCEQTGHLEELEDIAMLAYLKKEAEGEEDEDEDGDDEDEDDIDVIEDDDDVDVDDDDDDDDE